jgi:serine/threonine-protein kinase
MSDPIARLSAALADRYRIERELGQGGMATVYLAEDVKHERKVALKVLRPELAAVVGAERFLAEIKTTANLQHPHILPLFDSGEADSFLFYVMPYVEGDTLRARIDREKQLTVDEAIRIATGVAHALDHAHRHGVIHRDIKPANILLEDGGPVVADFGIALAVGVAGGSRLTETGLSLGTPYYMSPEQATGDQVVGPQTDIYALGCVLYEMLVGEPPYPGKTAQAVLGKIIAGKPVSATEQRPSIPAHVDAALRCALEKLPADRFTSGQDLVRALGDQHFRHGETAGAGLSAKGPWKWMAFAFAGLAAVATVLAAWALLSPEPPGQVVRVTLSTPEELTRGGAFALSPDGSAFVYEGPSESGGTQLWLRYMADLETTPLRGTDGARYPAMSPDGREVAFGVNSSIRVLPIQGGVSRTLADSAIGYPKWGSDGYVYFLGANYRACRVPAGGGPVEVVASPADGEAVTVVTDVLPGGEVVLLAVYPSLTSLNDVEVRALRLAKGEMTTLTTGMFPSLTPTGHLLYFTADSTLMAAPFDAEKLELAGPAIPLLERVSENGTGYFFASWSGTGTLLYRSGGRVGLFEPVWVERDGITRAIDPGWSFQGNSTNSSVALSPDGTRLAVSIGGAGAWDLWIKQLDRGPLSRLTFEGLYNRRAAWTPDGESVSFVSNRSGAYEVWRKRADGSTAAERVLSAERQVYEVAYSSDGTWMVYRVGTSTGGGNPDIYAVRQRNDTAGSPLLTGGFWESSPALSPDGRWLAYASNESGREEVYVRPFPDAGSARWQVSLDGGSEPVWAHSNREIFYRNGDRDMVAARVATGAPFAVTGQVVLFPGADYLSGARHAMYDVSRDDQRFVMLRVAGTGATGTLILVQNFFEELKQRVGS